MLILPRGPVISTAALEGLVMLDVLPPTSALTTLKATSSGIERGALPILERAGAVADQDRVCDEATHGTRKVGRFEVGGKKGDSAAWSVLLACGQPVLTAIMLLDNAVM